MYDVLLIQREKSLNLLLLYEPGLASCHWLLECLSGVGS